MEHKKIPSKDLSEKAGITYQSLNHYINGRREPDLERLAKILDVLDVSVDYFIGKQ